MGIEAATQKKSKRLAQAPFLVAFGGVEVCDAISSILSMLLDRCR